MDDSPPADDPSSKPHWRPLDAVERRTLGVLIEKAKTTPDAYPLSLNALRSGCNQKNNRFPQMQLEERQIEDALESLRDNHAVTFVQGDSRVERYRHLAYDWLGVSKVELAIIAELLLRGAQTLGELRSRAARMEPIRGQSELTPLVDGLLEKKLMVYVTRPGRGAVVAHNLYQPRELEKIFREHGASNAPQDDSPPPTKSEPSAGEGQDLSDLRAEIAALQAEFQAAISSLRTEMDDLRQRLG